MGEPQLISDHQDRHTGPIEESLRRIARVAAALFSAPFVQIIRFGDGDGVSAEPVSVGRLNGRRPDLRLVCASLPPAATMVVVEDAVRDGRQLNGLPSSTRFFALARVEDRNGRALGAICIADHAPATLSSAQADRLTDLAALTAEVIGTQEIARLTNDLAESAARFRALSETVFSALLITQGGVIVDANEHAATLIGIDDPELLIGRSVIDLVPEDRIELVQKQLGVSGSYEVPVVHADGHEILVEVQATTFPHAGGELRVAAVRPVGGG
ncbi:MAG: PAS domain S-box protein [Rubricoccaceae bacterium]|nr:PAS domain S-box protein [Rubricoccaceae bacterium]